MTKTLPTLVIHVKDYNPERAARQRALLAQCGVNVLIVGSRALAADIKAKFKAMRASR